MNNHLCWKEIAGIIAVTSSAGHGNPFSRIGRNRLVSLKILQLSPVVGKWGELVLGGGSRGLAWRRGACACWSLGVIFSLL